MKLNEIATIVGVSCLDAPVITGFSIDSRTLEAGNLFIALTGENFDGHDFIPAAIDKGAAAILCQRVVDDCKIAQLRVPDTLKALGLIATAHRLSLHCPIIALTGSNGKTTVKEMIAAVLPKPSHATLGNLNNHIGVPLSLLQLKPEHKYAVFELGANHVSEIAYTVAMVKPDVALINNIAPAHIEGFGSIEGVAKAKGEIYQGLTPQGTAIVNDDDAFAHFWDTAFAEKKVLRFSSSKPSDLYAENICFDAQNCAIFDLVFPSTREKIHLKVPGKHNIANALAAASCCFALKICVKDIVYGLEQFSGVAGRMSYKAGKNYSTVIDDTYNANLRSVLTALEVLSARKGKRIFVFGDMGELGTFAKQHHEEVGIQAKKLGIERLMTCGRHSVSAAHAFGNTAKHYESLDALIKDLLTSLDADTTVLVKGSRSSAMEKVVDQLVI